MLRSNSPPSSPVWHPFTQHALQGEVPLVERAEGAWLHTRDGKRISLIADYTRSTIQSDFNYLYPLGLFPVQSLYRDNAHSGTLMADLRLPLAKNYSGHLSFGGSFVTTTGTRPSNYYQPQGRIQLPVTPKLEFFSEWKYYGLHQPNYYYEGFRSHMFTGGVRFVM